MTGDDDESVPLSTRLINALAASAAAGQYAFLGGSSYAVQLPGGMVRSGTTAQMWAWRDGFAHGAQLPGPQGWWSTGGEQAAEQRHRQAEQDVEQFKQLLVDPSLVNQLRIEVLAAAESAGLNFKELAELIGRTPQSVRDALSFGHDKPSIGAMSLFDEMIRATGRRFRVSSIEPGTAPGGVPAAIQLDEPAGVTRMRALLIAAQRHLIDGVDPGAPNRARKATEFTVKICGETVVKPSATLLHWLRGVADGAGDLQAQVELSFEPPQRALPPAEFTIRIGGDQVVEPDPILVRWLQDISGEPGRVQ